MAQGFRGLTMGPDWYGGVHRSMEQIGQGLGGGLAALVQRRTDARKQQASYDALARLLESYSDQPRARVTSQQTDYDVERDPGTGEPLSASRLRPLGEVRGPSRPGVPTIPYPSASAPVSPSDRRFEEPPAPEAHLRTTPVPDQPVTRTHSQVLDEGQVGGQTVRMPGMRPIGLDQVTALLHGADAGTLDKLRFGLVSKMLERPSPIKVGDSLLDPESFEPLYTEPEAPTLKTGKPGDYLYSSEGAVLGQLPPAPDDVKNPTFWGVFMEAAGGDPAKAIELARQYHQASQANRNYITHVGRDLKTGNPIVNDTKDPNAPLKQQLPNGQLVRHVGPVGGRLGNPAEEFAVKRSFYTNIRSQADTARQILARRPELVGPITGRVLDMGLRTGFDGWAEAVTNEAMKKGVKLDREARIFYTALNNLYKQIYVETGKQVNIYEFSLLKGWLPGPGQTFDTTTVRLDQFINQLDNIWAGYQEGQRLRGAPPGQGTNIPGLPGQAPGADDADPLGIR